MDFSSETALELPGDGVWQGEIVPGWDTPLGPLGGYVMAIDARLGGGRRAPGSLDDDALRAQGGPVTVGATVERGVRQQVGGRWSRRELIGLPRGY